jgi:glycosyltransferase involved in cell wall biosynthesis
MIKEDLIHVPLERYKQRMTESLHDWETESFGKIFNVKTVVPDENATVMDIQSGRVLDSVGRPLWSLKQTQKLLSMGKDLGKIYFSDFYHSGLDALAYSGYSFQAFAFCWAQTFDQYDFTRQLHLSWMRPYEIMAFDIYHKVFVACEGLKDLIITAIPALAYDDKVKVVGLPFNSAYVKKQLDVRLCPKDPIDVVYTSRWDEEKQPGLFLDVVASTRGKFAVCTGSDDLRGTATGAIKRALELEERGKLTIYRNCTKAQYYAVLSRSHVQANTGLQDWVSFTLLEALTFGCYPLYPNHRSFPETLLYQDEYLYAPGEITSLQRKLFELLRKPRGQCQVAEPVLNIHDHTLDYIRDIVAVQ